MSTDSTPGDLYAAGARSFSIRGPNGGLVYDSGSTLDREAFVRGIYDDSRSRDKGVEPEGIAAYHYRGGVYLAIANETPGATGTSNTTLYRLEFAGGHD